MSRHVIDRVDGIPPGARKLVELDGRSIGVFNVDGEFLALRNRCPHHGAPLCQGPVSGTMLPSDPDEYRFSTEAEHQIIRCPWHGYEFRLDDGRGLVKPETSRVKTYRVEIEAGDVVVYTR